MCKIYLSQEKYNELKKEMEERGRNERLEISEKLQKAKEHGDLSESAEYADAKQMQAVNERRIFELEGILTSAEIIEHLPKSYTQIQVGSKVKVISQQGEKEFTILGPYEADPVKNLISYESPLGKAFIGRKVGDEALVETPSGAVKYKILSIQ